MVPELTDKFFNKTEGLLEYKDYMLDWSLMGGAPSVTDTIFEIGSKALFWPKGTPEVEPGPKPSNIMWHDDDSKAEF